VEQMNRREPPTVDEFISLLETMEKSCEKSESGLPGWDGTGAACAVVGTLRFHEYDPKSSMCLPFLGGKREPPNNFVGFPRGTCRPIHFHRIRSIGTSSRTASPA